MPSAAKLLSQDLLVRLRVLNWQVWQVGLLLPFPVVLSVQPDVEKALDEQLFFCSVPHRKVRPRQHQRLADPRRLGTVALGIVILA